MLSIKSQIFTPSVGETETARCGCRWIETWTDRNQYADLVAPASAMGFTFRALAMLHVTLLTREAEQGGTNVN